MFYHQHGLHKLGVITKSVCLQVTTDFIKQTWCCFMWKKIYLCYFFWQCPIPLLQAVHALKCFIMSGVVHFCYYPYPGAVWTRASYKCKMVEHNTQLRVCWVTIEFESQRTPSFCFCFLWAGIALFLGKAQLLGCKHHLRNYIPPLVDPGKPQQIDCVVKEVTYVGPFTNETEVSHKNSWWFYRHDIQVSVLQNNHFLF